MKTVIVTPRGEASLKRRHPWIFSGAVQNVNEKIGPGATVAICAADGRWLAWGAFSPKSQIRVRVWSFDPHATIDDAFFGRRMEAALRLRSGLPATGTAAARRLVNAESDGLPGVIVDQYGDFLICQFLTAGAERWRTVMVEQLHRLMPAAGIYERSDAGVRRKEGLEPRCGVLRGRVPPELLKVEMGPMAMWVDVRQGHKTGLYLDQRENQARVAPFADGGEVLNCFSYTGGFGICAFKGGAVKVTQIDASESALALSRKNIGLNGLDESRAEHLCGNVFEILRQFRDSRRSFDLIVLDPPKFVASKGQLTKGARAYKDINLLAFKLLRPNGALFTFSCSGLVSAQLFQKIVADAALDAGRPGAVIGRMGQPADHPVALSFPEGRYLKGLICKV